LLADIDRPLLQSTDAAELAREAGFSSMKMTGDGWNSRREKRSKH